MRRCAMLAVCCLAVTLGSLIAADSAEARRRFGRLNHAPRAPLGTGYAPAPYPTYFTPRNPYGPSYYNPHFYGGYYGRGFYASPRGPMYIGW